MDSHFVRWMIVVGLAVGGAAGCGDDDSAADDAGRDDGGGTGAASRTPRREPCPCS